MNKDCSDFDVTINFSANAHSGRYEDPEDFWQIIDCDIFLEANNKTKAGFIKCYKLDVQKAIEYRGSMVSVFDAHDETLCIYSHLWDEDYDDFISETDASAFLGAEYLILIEIFFIEPKYRGMKVGAAALKRVIQHIANDASIITLQSSPLQFKENLTKLLDLSELPSDELDANEQLKSYYTKQGFFELPTKNYMIYNHP